MSSIKRGINYFFHDRAQLCDSIVKNYLKWLPDKQFLSLRYRFNEGYWVDWKEPKKFTEKLQWLKVFNRKSIYTTMVDKFAVKKYVADVIGEKYIIPTLGVWEKPEDIDWNSLPSQFVLKTTHGGGSCGVVICKDKNSFDYKEATKKLTESLQFDIYAILREWPYKYVKKKIIAEKYMTSMDYVNEFDNDLIDYKFFCFNGVPKYCQVIRDRHTNESIDFYDMQWKHQDFVGLNVSCKTKPIDKPACLDEMIRVCKALSVNIPFLRVDLYDINGNVYFGELTFYPASGFGTFRPEIWNEKLGNLITLPTRDITNKR